MCSSIFARNLALARWCALHLFDELDITLDFGLQHAGDRLLETRSSRASVNPLTAGAAYIRVFIFY